MQQRRSGAGDQDIAVRLSICALHNHVMAQARCQLLLGDTYSDVLDNQLEGAGCDICGDAQALDLFRALNRAELLDDTGCRNQWLCTGTSLPDRRLLSPVSHRRAS